MAIIRNTIFPYLRFTLTQALENQVLILTINNIAYTFTFKASPTLPFEVSNVGSVSTNFYNYFIANVPNLSDYTISQISNDIIIEANRKGFLWNVTISDSSNVNYTIVNNYIYDLNTFAEGCVKFYLEYDAVKTEIIEPQGFDDIMPTLERNLSEHGFNYLFTDGEFPLTFACSDSRTIIENAYNTDGADAEIDFIIEIGSIEHFRGVLNFSIYNNDIEGIKLNVEETSKIETIKARLDTPVRLEDTTDIEGNALTTFYQPRGIWFHGSEFIEAGTWANPTGGVGYANYINANQSITNSYQWLAGYEVTQLDIAMQSYPYQINASVIFDKKYVHEVEIDGTYTINIDFNMIAYFKAEGSEGGGVYDFAVCGSNVALYYSINNAPIQLYVESFSAETNHSIGIFSFSVEETRIISQSFSIELNLIAGDEIYVYNTFSYGLGTGDGSIASLDTSFTFNNDSTNFISIERKTITKPVKVQGLLLKECFQNTILKYINEDIFNSEFLSLCGNKYFVTTGRLLKQLPYSGDAVITTSFEQLFKLCVSLFSAGYQVKDDEVRVEQMSNFYQTVQIDTFTGAVESSIEHANEIDYNTIIQGFDDWGGKGETSDPNGRNEFLTKKTWATPIKRNNKKLDLTNDFVASGTAIEVQKRAAQNNQSNNKFDDKLFIVALSNSRIINNYYGQNYTFEITTTEVIIIGFDFTDNGAILYTDITLDNTDSDGNYSIVSSVYDAGANKTTFEVSGVLTPQTVFIASAQFTLESTNTLFTEQDQNFAVRTGLPINPYNARLALSRTLRNNALLINSSLVYKEDTAKLVLTKYEGNQQISLQWSNSETCTGLVSTLLTNEANDIELNLFNAREAKFMPQIINKTVECSLWRFNQLKENLTNSNVGYIEIDSELIYPLSIKFHLKERIGMIDVRGLKVNTEGIGYLLQENGDYILQEDSSKILL